MLFQVCLFLISILSHHVMAQPPGSFQVVCRTGNNDLSYFGYTAPNTPHIYAQFKHGASSWNAYLSGALNPGECTRTDRAFYDYEAKTLEMIVDPQNTGQVEIAVWSIRMPNLSNQIQLIAGSNTLAQLMFNMQLTNGNFIGFWVVPIAQPVNYALAVVSSFTVTPLTFYFPPITINIPSTIATVNDVTSQDISVSQPQTTTTTSTSPNNTILGIAIGVSICGGIILGILLHMAYIVHRQRKTQTHVIPLTYTATTTVTPVSVETDSTHPVASATVAIEKP